MTGHHKTNSDNPYQHLKGEIIKSKQLQQIKMESPGKNKSFEGSKTLNNNSKSSNNSY